MNGVMKGLMLAFMIIYVISPVDAMPGPIDDILVTLIGIAARNNLDKVRG